MAANSWCASFNSLARRRSPCAHRRVDEAVERHHREDRPAGADEVGVDADRRRAKIMRREIGVGEDDAVAMSHVAEHRERVAVQTADRCRSASDSLPCCRRNLAAPAPWASAFGRSGDLRPARRSTKARRQLSQET